MSRMIINPKYGFSPTTTVTAIFQSRLGFPREENTVPAYKSQWSVLTVTSITEEGVVTPRMAANDLSGCQLEVRGTHPEESTEYQQEGVVLLEHGEKRRYATIVPPLDIGERYSIKRYKEIEKDGENILLLENVQEYKPRTNEENKRKTK